MAAVVKETYSLIKIIHPISPNYGCENGVKQIKITEKNLCQLLRTKSLPSRAACIKYFSLFLPLLPYICRVDVIYLTCLVFLKAPNGSFGYLVLQLPLLKKSNYEDRTEANILRPIGNF